MFYYHGSSLYTALARTADMLHFQDQGNKILLSKVFSLPDARWGGGILEVRERVSPLQRLTVVVVATTRY